MHWIALHMDINVRSTDPSRFLWTITKDLLVGGCWLATRYAINVKIGLTTIRLPHELPDRILAILVSILREEKGLPSPVSLVVDDTRAIAINRKSIDFTMSILIFVSLVNPNKNSNSFRLHKHSKQFPEMTKYSWTYPIHRVHI